MKVLSERITIKKQNQFNLWLWLAELILKINKKDNLIEVICGCIDIIQ